MRDFREFRERQRRRCEERVERHRNGHGHIWTGAFILLIGVAAMIRVAVPDLPPLLFSWQTFLIALGVFIGAKHRFRGGAWFVLILVGTGFLLRDIYPDLAIRRYIWPMVFIVVGAFLIIRPRRYNWSNTELNEKKRRLLHKGQLYLMKKKRGARTTM